MTVNLVLFTDWGRSSSPARKGEHCGYLGLRPSTPSQPARPKSPKWKSLRNAWPTLCPSTPRGLGPDTSRPRNARPVLRPGARVSHSPNVFFNSSAYFSDQQLYQTKFPTGSPHYKREFTHELTPLPLTK